MNSSLQIVPLFVYFSWIPPASVIRRRRQTSPFSDLTIGLEGGRFRAQESPVASFSEANGLLNAPGSP